MNSDDIIDNTVYLSSLGRYNSERRPVVRQYFDRLLQERNLAHEEISIEDVRFWPNLQPYGPQEPG